MQKHSPLPSKNDNFWKNYEQNLGTVKEEEAKESNQERTNLEDSMTELALPSSLAENADEDNHAAQERDKHSGDGGIGS